MPRIRARRRRRWRRDAGRDHGVELRPPPGRTPRRRCRLHRRSTGTTLLSRRYGSPSSGATIWMPSPFLVTAGPRIDAPGRWGRNRRRRRVRHRRASLRRRDSPGSIAEPPAPAKRALELLGEQGRHRRSMPCGAGSRDEATDRGGVGRAANSASSWETCDSNASPGERIRPPARAGSGSATCSPAPPHQRRQPAPYRRACRQSPLRAPHSCSTRPRQRVWTMTRAALHRAIGGPHHHARESSKGGSRAPACPGGRPAELLDWRRRAPAARCRGGAHDHVGGPRLARDAEAREAICGRRPARLPRQTARSTRRAAWAPTDRAPRLQELFGSHQLAQQKERIEARRATTTTRFSGKPCSSAASARWRAFQHEHPVGRECRRPWCSGCPN